MEFLRIQRLCLNGIGYSFKHNESRGRQIFALLSWVSILIVIIPEWHFVIENISDIPLATDALCPLLTSILTISKVMTFYFRKGKFYDIIEQLDNMWLKSSPSDQKILEKGHKTDKRLTLCYFITSVGCAVLYLLLPIVKAVYELQTTGTAEWIMPMRSIFLYDISISPYYELTYLWFAQCTYLAVCGSVGVDCLFYGSAFNISAHFQIVQNKIRHINFAVIAIEEKKRYGKRVATREFFEVIRYHQKLLNICDKFEHMYAPVLFTQFLITSVQLCVIAFQLTLPNQEPMMMATYTLFLLAICFQLYTYCHAGSQLTVESLTVADAIYDSDWYKATPSLRKSVQFFLMRSQKCVIISSGFYVANLETYNAILSSAGSYIALLQSLSEDK